MEVFLYNYVEFSYLHSRKVELVKLRAVWPIMSCRHEMYTTRQMKTIQAAVQTYGLLNEMPVRDGLLERREGGMCV